MRSIGKREGQQFSGTMVLVGTRLGVMAGFGICAMGKS